MSFDSVPFVIGGGAQHSPEVFRTLAYAALGGAEGVIGPTDLKVVPLATPGTSIRALPGAVGVLNRSTGGSQQSYAGRNPTEDVVAVAPTGSSGGRVDLVVARVEDPFMAGTPWAAPADPTLGPYIFTRIVPNVPAGTTRLQDIPAYAGQSAVTLARLDIPANTGTITAAMITDLRRMATPRNARTLDTFIGTGGDLTSSTEVIWPSNATLVDVPPWATRLRGVVNVMGMVQSGGNVSAEFRVRIGSSGDYTVGATSVFDNDTAATTSERQALAFPIDIAIPTGKRGKPQPVAILARRAAGPGKLTARGGTTVSFDFYFTEEVS